MGGRGPRYAPGVSVLDPLMAQALLLQDATGRRQLWISLDLIGIDHGRSAALRQDLAALSRVPYEGVLLNFAHIHSGPMTNFLKYPTWWPEPSLLNQYQWSLRRALHVLVERALAEMQPVEVWLHRGASDLGINRRRRDKNGQVILAPNPQGFNNRDLWVLDLRSLGNDRRAVVFSYGCHPVIVYGFAWDGISAGYPGATRRYLRESLGHHPQSGSGDVHCQFLQGLAGNVRPRVLADVEAGTFRKASSEDLVAAGKTLAKDVLHALGTNGERMSLTLAAVANWIHPRRDLDSVPPLSHWQAMAAREDELSRNAGRYWAKRIAEGHPLPPVLPMEIGMLQLAPGTKIAWFNAEAVAEWLPLLRSRLQDPDLFSWGYCQEVSTYLPTDTLLSEGGYEVINANWYDVHGPAPFARGLDETVLRGFRALVQGLG